ncbi:hypothetical protein SOVF_077290 [Spinacia oleracea]|uniref:Probable beta-D-xylosidase 7 n=1 Tax=Spinacia oleracea TaxID=3562 RepID=A0A9R0I403_SPIOL|nr:probable beta-D-xylosidase 7 [Spinacia oleracea]KNA17712.1 hypothetical protein SOVF_077290 [Spinacia oleracea]
MGAQKCERATHLPTTIIICLIFTTILQLGLVNSVIPPPPPPPQPPLFACDSANPHTKSYPFCNPQLPINKRVKDLVSRLTLDEKISQLTNSAPPIPRLGVPAYEWWSESLHGVSRHGRGYRFNGTFAKDGSVLNGTATVKAATMFPQIILTASSFDSQLWYRIAKAIATEARAMYNVGQGKGLTFWAPNINIFRDPRWGRGQETPGEDPLLTSTYGVSYVRGLQGYTFHGDKISDRLQASACCKHFTAHDLDNWHGITRFTFDAEVSKQDLADTFQPPFQSCVEQGHASSIMCAYNRVNGIPSCAHQDFLTDTARGKWHFDGYIVSDCNAVPIIYEPQKYAKTPEDAVAAVLSAGMDLECGPYTQTYTKSAINQKKVTEKQIDRALKNSFSVRMRLGLFDGDPRINGSFGKIGPEQVCSEEHQNLALEAAQNSIVLLKNNNNLLPLSKSKTNSTLAVIGPNADSLEVLLGNYEGFPCKSTTILQALQSYVEMGTIKYHSGCNAVECSSVEVEQVVEIAKEVDYVVMVMGLDQTQEREKLDRVDLVLPGMQQSLIASVAEAAKKPIVLVLLCGGPVDVSLSRDDNKVGSILWAGYPGEAGGLALAKIIFGDHNPGGKLPITWYPQDFTEVPMTDMRMRPNKSSGYPGRTYRFYQGKKVYEFGYGLSYSNYSYKFTSVTRDKFSLNQEFTSVSRDKISLNQESDVNQFLVSQLGTQFCDKQKFSAVVRVKNTGKIAGKHPVLLFVRTDLQNDETPMKQLIGFESVNLNAEQESEVEFSVSPCEHLSKANKDGEMVIDNGVYFLVVGEEAYQINVAA